MPFNIINLRNLSCYHQTPRLLVCFVALFGFLFFSACDINDNESPIPAFIVLESPKVTEPLTGNTDTNKILDAWVFADGQILGVFPLPARVPITTLDKEVEILILAGIRNNGMNDIPVFYPFYQSITQKVNLQANQIISIPMNFGYNSKSKIPINESFEDDVALFSVDLDNNTETNVNSFVEDASVGQKCMVASFNSNISYIEVASTVAIDKFNNLQGQSYIEFDYKGSGEIAVGILKSNSNKFTVEYVLFVPAKAEWNKIYVDVTNVLSPRDYEEYRLAFGFRRTGGNVDGKIFIDNLKHCHF